MMIVSWLLLACLASQVQANVKAVFAHFMLSNTESYTLVDWQDDISKAAAAHIDGFVLNMGRNEATNGASLANAFTAANNLGSTFKLLFSFDYAGNGLWDKADVIALTNQWSSNPAYYRRGSQPLVSTFEGPAASGDWPDIKAATGCFFMPSWSSLGAAPAWAKGQADGLFSWAAWPTGPNSMSTFTDHSYMDALGGAPYMMGISPWFYTNMPGFRKNWLWRGDSLWFDRWVHVMSLQPDYVQIITWNDYGESHHIGPLRSHAYEAFDRGLSPFNYVVDKPHDGWRTFLPFLIDMAKRNTTSITQENVVAWYRETPGSACGTGGTTGNTASQLQETHAPGALAEDSIFYAALLGSSGASVSVLVGGQSVAGTWTVIPSGGIGLYRGSVPMGGRTGNVVVTITRSGSQILQASGNPITTACTQGSTNWNPSVITGTPRSIAAVSPLSLSRSVCTSGFGDPKYLGLCSVACKYSYCPQICTCTSLGAEVTKPTARDVNGCPAPGMDSTYLGLCSFACNYGYCPESLCQVYPASHDCTAPDPVAPPIPVCVGGMADGVYADLCSFSCHFGFCPPEICTCTQARPGPGPSPPALTSMVGGPAGGSTTDHGLCEWACRHGNCPSHLCSCSGSGCPDQGEMEGLPGLVGAPSFDRPSLLAGINVLTRKHSGSFGSTKIHTIPGISFDKVIRGEPTCGYGTYCVNQDDPLESACYPGMVKMGWDKDGCSGPNRGRSICCPASEAVTECSWRGGGGTNTLCNGQCNAGQVSLWTSKWGGGRGSMAEKCFSGHKTLCCDAIEYGVVTNKCRWTGCGLFGDGNHCTKDEVSVVSKTTTGFCFAKKLHYCCPKPPLLHDCRWRGRWPNCAGNDCENDEVALDHNSFGDTSNSCFFGSKKVACCKVHPLPAPKKERKCNIDFCSYFPRECEEEEGESEDDLAKRQVRPRARGRKMAAEKGSGLNDFYSNPYDSRGSFVKKLFKSAPRVAWWAVSEFCDITGVTKESAATAANVPDLLDTEHPIDLQVLMRWAESCVTNHLPDGTKSRYAAISKAYFNTIFTKDGQLPVSLPKLTPTSPVFTMPMNFVYESFGSRTNMGPLMLADRLMNQIKGKFLGLKLPINAKTMELYVTDALAGVPGQEDLFLAYLQKGVSVFKYLQEPEVAALFHEVRDDIYNQLLLVQQNTLGAANLANKWGEYFPILLKQVARNSQQWLRDMIEIALLWYNRVRPANYWPVIFYLQTYLTEIADMVMP